MTLGSFLTSYGWLHAASSSSRTCPGLQSPAARVHLFQVGAHVGASTGSTQPRLTASHRAVHLGPTLFQGEESGDWGLSGFQSKFLSFGSWEMQPANQDGRDRWPHVPLTPGGTAPALLISSTGHPLHASRAALPRKEPQGHHIWN